MEIKTKIKKPSGAFLNDEKASSKRGLAFIAYDFLKTILLSRFLLVEAVGVRQGSLLQVRPDIPINVL